MWRASPCVRRQLTDDASHVTYKIACVVVIALDNWLEVLALLVQWALAALWTKVLTAGINFNRASARSAGPRTRRCVDTSSAPVAGRVPSTAHARMQSHLLKTSRNTNQTHCFRFKNSNEKRASCCLNAWGYACVQTLCVGTVTLRLPFLPARMKLPKFDISE